MCPLLSPEEEETLIARFPQDPDAIRLLYRHYFPRVFTYVSYRVGDQRDAEDLTSEIFLKVVEAMTRFEYRGVGSFAAWLFRIAYNTIARFYRTDISQDDLSSLHELASPDLMPDELFLQNEDASTLQSMIHTLPPRRRDIVMLRFFGGLRNQEIALVMNLDQRTVASHLSRALEDLLHKYQQVGVQDE